MPAPTFYLSLRYADADAAIAWLEGTLGFEQLEVHRDDDGKVAHAELALDGTIAMLGTAGVGREPFRDVPSGNGLFYIAVDDVDALHGRVREAGGEIAVGLEDTDYGSRDFTVRDPEGNLWAFGTYRPTA